MALHQRSGATVKTKNGERTYIADWQGRISAEILSYAISGFTTDAPGPETHMEVSIIGWHHEENGRLAWLEVWR